METKYNRAKLWQLILFTFNNTASNTYLIMMGFVSYYANGVAGLGVAFVSNVIMLSRIWDGVTDPIIGFFVDRTKGRFGKFRPYMLFGNIVMFISVLLMFSTTHLVSGMMKGIYFILIYAIYIVGYTCQNCATRGGQTVVTNDPKQRPIYARCESIINSLLASFITVYVTNYLVKKHGGFTGALFLELIVTMGLFSFILTILALIGIAQKDQPEFYEVGKKDTSYRFRDIFTIVKGNRAIQMLVLAASTDKLGMMIMSNATVGVMLYGIVMGNYDLLGLLSTITIIPSIILIWIGTAVASRYSLKKSMVVFTWINIGFAVALALLLILGDPTKISLTNFNFMTAAYIVLYVMMRASGVSGGIATPMIADCADYELYLSGKYAPALMGTVSGFFDKTVSAFASTIVGYCVIAIGFKEQFPQIGDPYTPAIFWMSLFLFLGIPILGWIATLIAMKFYPLDQEKMIEVQAKIANMKKENA